MTATNYQGLGRGLEALLKVQPGPSQSTQSDNQGFQKLPIFSLKSGRYQPRHHFDEESLATLADSIKSQGMVQPIIVQKLSDKEYEIIAGERRWRASQLAGLAEVPVVIRDDIAPQQAMAVALIENIQRQDLNAIEEAEGLQRLHQEFQMTHDQIAQLIGRSRAAVSNSLRLLDLDQRVQNLVRDDKLKMGHVRALLSLEGEDQLNLANQAANRNMSTRQVEKAAQALLTSKPIQVVDEQTRIEVDKLQVVLKQALRSEVKINTRQNGAGQVQIPFNSLSELQSLVKAWVKGLNSK